MLNNQYCSIPSCWQHVPCPIHKHVIKVDFDEYYYLELLAQAKCAPCLTFRQYEDVHDTYKSRQVRPTKWVGETKKQWICYTKQCFGNHIRKGSNAEHCIVCDDDPHHYRYRHRFTYWCMICQDHKDKDHIHYKEKFLLAAPDHGCYARSCWLRTTHSIDTDNHFMCDQCHIVHKRGLYFCTNCNCCFETKEHCQACIRDPHHIRPKHKKTWCPNCQVCRSYYHTHCDACNGCFYNPHCHGLQCVSNPHHDPKIITCKVCVSDPHHDNPLKKSHKVCIHCKTCHSIYYYRCRICGCVCNGKSIEHCRICVTDPHHDKMTESEAQSRRACDHCNECHAVEYMPTEARMTVRGNYHDKYRSYLECVTEKCMICKKCYNKRLPHSCLTLLKSSVNMEFV